MKTRFTVYSFQFGNEPCETLEAAEVLYAGRCTTEPEVTLYDWSLATEAAGEAAARLKTFVAKNEI